MIHLKSLSLTLIRNIMSTFLNAIYLGLGLVTRSSVVHPYYLHHTVNHRSDRCVFRHLYLELSAPKSRGSICSVTSESVFRSFPITSQCFLLNCRSFSEVASLSSWSMYLARSRAEGPAPALLVKDSVNILLVVAVLGLPIRGDRANHRLETLGAR